MRTAKPALCLFIMLAAAAWTSGAAAQRCTGRFVNPVTDICWECAFPISIGPTRIGDEGAPDTRNPSNPICWCGEPVPVPGIAFGFWEPIRLLDATRVPGCFVNLGGVEIDLDTGLFRRGGTFVAEGTRTQTFMQVHQYTYPVWTLLEVLVNKACLDHWYFDIAYVSELDPLWHDDKLAFLLAPEAILFANPIAGAACVADCVLSTTGLSPKELFWCAGCQGGMYPMTGNITQHESGIQVALLAANRLMYHLHRATVARGTYGDRALCGRYPMPIMEKRQYRWQLTNPTPMTNPRLGCNPAGRTTIHFEGLGGEFPVGGENWGWLLWRKRNCCLL